MKSSIKKRLRRFSLFRMFSWMRDQYLIDTMEYTAKFKSCGTGVRIDRGVSISHCDMVTVGDNVIIHRGVLINARGGLHIGNNSGISYNSVIWTGHHNYENAERIPFDDKVILKPVRINDNVWVGSNVCISGGVEIGEGAVIGMASNVTKDIPPLAIVLGNPCRIIGYRDKEHYETCKASGMFVQHSVIDQMVIPRFIQKRPNLYKLVEGKVASGEFHLEEDPGE
jgi:maltose O-acetyltransferase